MIELPEEIDLAVIALPNRRVCDAVVECGEMGVKFAIVISADSASLGAPNLNAK